MRQVWMMRMMKMMKMMINQDRMTKDVTGDMHQDESMEEDKELNGNCTDNDVQSNNEEMQNETENNNQDIIIDSTKIKSNE